MKIEALKENLKSGLSVVEKNIGKNISLPILDNVFLSTHESFLNLTSTDLEAVIKVWILTKVVKKGTAVVPAKFLSQFISSLPNDKVVLELQGQNMHIECQNVKTTIQGHNPEDFPLIPEFKHIDSLEIDNRKFCQGLSQVINVASNSPTRPEIGGIYFSFSKDALKVVATDSFRLAEKTITLKNTPKKEYSFILPQKSAREIVSILEDKEGVLTIYFSANQVLFEFPFPEIKHPNVHISSRLVEGEYPQYQDIIPKNFKTTITLKKDEFISQLKTASLFANRNNEVRVAVKASEKEVDIKAQNPAVGEHISTIVAEITGEDVEVSFNYKFLIEGLFHIKSSEVVFGISKEDGPCILRPVADESYLYVVMPIKAI